MVFTFFVQQGVIRRLSDGQLKFFLLASTQPVSGSQRNRPILPASNLLRDDGSAVMTNTSNSESSWMLVETQDSGLSPNYLVPAPSAIAIAPETQLTAETSVGCDSTVSLLSSSPRPVQQLALEAVRISHLFLFFPVMFTGRDFRLFSRPGTFPPGRPRPGPAGRKRRKSSHTTI